MAAVDLPVGRPAEPDQRRTGSRGGEGGAVPTYRGDTAGAGGNRCRIIHPPDPPMRIGVGPTSTAPSQPCCHRPGHTNNTTHATPNITKARRTAGWERGETKRPVTTIANCPSNVVIGKGNTPPSPATTDTPMPTVAAKAAPRARKRFLKPGSGCRLPADGRRYKHCDQQRERPRRRGDVSLMTRRRASRRTDRT